MLDSMRRRARLECSYSKIFTLFGILGSTFRPADNLSQREALPLTTASFPSLHTTTSASGQLEDNTGKTSKTAGRQGSHRPPQTIRASSSKTASLNMNRGSICLRPSLPHNDSKMDVFSRERFVSDVESLCRAMVSLPSSSLLSSSQQPCWIRKT